MVVAPAPGLVRRGDGTRMGFSHVEVQPGLCARDLDRRAARAVDAVAQVARAPAERLSPQGDRADHAARAYPHRAVPPAARHFSRRGARGELDADTELAGA